MANSGTAARGPRGAIDVNQNKLAPSRGRKGPRLGYLVANGQTLPVPCVVRDLDDGAATLVVGGWLGVPDTFSLYVEPDQLRLDCVIAARHGNALKVRFGAASSEPRPRPR